MFAGIKNRYFSGAASTTQSMIPQFPAIRAFGGLLLPMVVALVFCHAARAQTVTVWNPGFEQPVLSKGSFSADVPGWGANPPLSVAHPGTSMPAAPQGNQYLWGGASGNFTVTQLAGALVANNRYDFSIKVYPVTNPEQARFTVQLIEQGSGVIMNEKLYRPFWITPAPPSIFGQPHPKAHPDLRNSPNYKGVVTQIRLDPTDVAGAQFGVDHVRLLPDVEEIKTSLSWLPGTGSNLRFNSDPGTRFRLYQSSDLIEWTPQRVLTTDANGRAEHTDESAHGAPRRFYKLGLEP